MTPPVFPSLRHGFIGLALSACLAGPASAAGPFTGFPGSWNGGGNIALTDGSREAIRCRATYALDGSGTAMRIDVNCASDSYRVHIVADVRSTGNEFAGNWQETTRGIGGDVTGRVPSPGEMQANLQAFGGGIQLAARSDGRRQAISMNSQGTEVAGATISLKRR